MSHPRSQGGSLNAFYRDYAAQVIIGVIVLMFALLITMGVVCYLVVNRPLPQFSAQTQDGRTRSLIAYDAPNRIPGALLSWAGKAAVAAYTFDFANYEKQFALARPYFTPGGWRAYQAAIADVVQRIKKSQLVVSGVVSGAPVISNQGELIGHGYSWRVQIPFIVTYESAEESRPANYYVILTIVKVPTTQSPEGVGVDQFEMVRA